MHNKLTNELAVCGFNAIRALSEVHPDTINRLFLREDRLPLFSGLCKRLAERKRPYKICENEELEKICKTNHHQGIVAMIYEPVVEAAAPEDTEVLAVEGKTGLLLCDLGNDLNLGAVVRSAAFFDVLSVFLAEQNNPDAVSAASEKRGSPPEQKFLSTAAYRAAEGGMEYVQFRLVRNPAAFLRSASKKLVTIGTDIRSRSRIRDIPILINDRYKNMFGKNNRPGIILVIGNEETGLPAEVKEQCSILVRIPGTGIIESLNAAQAASIFLYELYERFG
ncbi:MAG: RNA methyltransferase [Treponema sp.]|jgi:TrmH RNA methyltransferase|nr:RNA methyltransferase [Treponema sp.]